MMDDITPEENGWYRIVLHTDNPDDDHIQSFEEDAEWDGNTWVDLKKDYPRYYVIMILSKEL